MHKCTTCKQMFRSPMVFIHHMVNNHKTADVNFLQTWTLESLLKVGKPFVEMTTINVIIVIC